MNNIRIQPQTGHINFTPFAMAKMSNGLFNASNSYKDNSMVMLNYFLYSASIELGLKSSILSQDNSESKKKYLKSKNIGHDLNKAYKEFSKYFNVSLFDSSDLIIMNKINKYYRNKGLEYITIDIITSLAIGLKPFPKLEELEKVSKKMNDFLLNNKYFINCM